MQPIDIPKFLGLRNTVSEARQPLGALTHADNVLVDDSGAIIRRKGYTKIASGNITGSYGTRDNSAIYVVDNGGLYHFNGTDFTLLYEGMGSSACYWAEESASLIFMRNEQRFIAIQDGVRAVDLEVPVLADANITHGAGTLPQMSVGLTAQYVHTTTGLRGAMCPHQIVDVAENSSLLITVPPVSGFRVAIYGFFPDSGAWSWLGDTDNFHVISSYPNTHIAADGVYFDVSSVPDNAVAMTYHLGKIAIASTSTDQTSQIQFSVPGFYHLFDLIDEAFSIPDLITGLASVQGQLLITGLRSIWVYSEGGLQRLCAYGTPVGKPIQEMADGSVLIWTNRGMCKYPEFQNLTAQDFSVPAGFGCATSLMEVEGSKFLTITTDDNGVAFNQAFPV
jgi:hypothetical protein